MKKATARMERPTERALRFALVGLVAGIAAGLAFSLPIWLTGGLERGGGGSVLAFLIGFPAGGFIGGFLMGLVREGLGMLVDGSLQGGRGRTRSEYSQAQSLVIRGSYEEAVDLYQAAASEDPKSPEPLLLGARVLRDHLGQPEAAAEWLRRGLRVQPLSPQQDIILARELVELYDGPLGSPEKAIPELARIAATYPDTSAGQWARNLLTRIRAAVWTDLKGGDQPVSGGET